MTSERQSTALPPAQPSYIFRGHTAQIHSVQIVRQNTRLLTGDADGWVVCWRLESKRPVAVWRAHDATILGTAEWGSDRLITHGRDNTLRIWQLRATDEPSLSTVLPADGSTTHRPKPWLLHTLPVNTLNFCAFSMCHERHAFNLQHDEKHASSSGLSDFILVAVPARDDRKIEIYRFPEEKLTCVVPRVQPTDTGMVMAVKLAHHRPSNNLLVIAGYEGGFTAVHILPSSCRSWSQATTVPSIQLAQAIYLSQPHSQPILSLDTSPDAKTYYSSSADAVIAAHRIPELPLNMNENNDAFDLNPEETSTRIPSNEHEAQTPSIVTKPQSSDKSTDVEHVRHLGTSQQDLASSTAGHPTDHAEILNADVGGLDGEEPASEYKITVAEETNTALAQTTGEPLTFGKKSVSQPLSFSRQDVLATSSTPATSGLSSLLSTATSHSKTKPNPPFTPDLTVQTPYKTIHTKHAGQQSLYVRSDGRLLVTGGWDSRVRIYSTKTLKELAVLKWHKEGVYATAFGEIFGDEPPQPSSQGENDVSTSTELASTHGTISESHADKVPHGLSKLQKHREEQIQKKHWVAAGAKDGKVSLWEVF